MPVARSISRVLANRVVGATRTRPSRFRLAGGEISSGGCSGRFRKSDPVHLRRRGVLRASRRLPGIAAIVSLYGLFADASTIGKHLSLLSGFLPGGVLQLIADQITLISRQGNETLGPLSSSDCLSPLEARIPAWQLSSTRSTWSTTSEEKRSLVRLLRHHVLFTLAGIVFVILAITGVVVLPLMLKFVGLADDDGMADSLSYDGPFFS